MDTAYTVHQGNQNGSLTHEPTPFKAKHKMCVLLSFSRRAVSKYEIQAYILSNINGASTHQPDI